MKKTFLLGLASASLLVLSSVHTASAADPNSQPRVPKKVTNFTCVSEGWDIEVKEYDTGQDQVRFTGMPQIVQIVRELPTGWTPNPSKGESAVFHDEIVEDVTKPNNGKICATDGSVIGYGQDYVTMTRKNDQPWNHTQAFWEGDVSNVSFLDAGQVLKKFRPYLSQQVNVGPLPTSDHCASAQPVCSFAGPTTTDYSDSAAPGMNRISMTDLAASDMSGSDIFYYLRGPDWGSHVADLHGFTYSWIRVMDNLGIINSSAVRQSMLPTPAADGSTFIFKRLELPTYDMIPLIEEDDDDLELIIVPRTVASNGGSWPTSNRVDQSQPPIFQGGRPNPNYCPQNDPGNDAYIPQYLSDPAVVVELSNDLRFLTEAQLERIEDTGWRITRGQKDWEDEDFANAIPENPSLARPTYDCMAPMATTMANRPQTRSRTAQPGRADSQAGMVCKTKDVAYYDALIARLIVVNPVIGNVMNHPCNKVKNLMGGAAKPMTAPKPASVVLQKPARSLSAQPRKMAPVVVKKPAKVNE